MYWDPADPPFSSLFFFFYLFVDGMRVTFSTWPVLPLVVIAGSPFPSDCQHARLNW